MDARAVLTTKRDGGELSDAAIESFLEGYVSGAIPDYQASALLMAIYVHGMRPRELATWTRAMLNSGEVYAFGELDKPTVDKHSTGGIGDKASIPLAPAVAACGAAVPMVSGRGLGHTGGTLDKLEAIPGLSTALAREDFARLLREIGVAMGGQTAALVPADRKLYALRDVTGLIESVPLIASSILSKKLAEGIGGLVLDVKFGSGAFLCEVERGAELARCMLDIASEVGVRAAAYQTAMDRPLGCAIGHTLEIEESLDCLRGGGPADLRELVCLLGGEMLSLAGIASDTSAGSSAIAAALDDGRALEVFARMVAAQGGDTKALDDASRMPSCAGRSVFEAPASGHLSWGDLRGLGRALTALGGGRRALDDEVDHAVGLRVLRPTGAELRAGEPLIEVHHRAGAGLDEALRELAGAIHIGPLSQPTPLVLGRME